MERVCVELCDGPAKESWAVERGERCENDRREKKMTGPQTRHSPRRRARPLFFPRQTHAHISHTMSCSPSKRRELDVTKLLMSDWKVELVEDNLSEFYIEFAGPPESESWF
jgi:hypothetical protein